MKQLPRRMLWLLIVIALQVLVLLGAVALHGARLADGMQVRVEVRPLDPLDPVRGSYSALTYPFQQLPVPAGTGDAYVLLVRPAASKGIWKTTRVTDDIGDLKDADAWIKLPRNDRELNIESIGTYYASDDRSKELDSQLAESGGVATLSLNRDGHPTLVDVQASD